MHDAGEFNKYRDLMSASESEPVHGAPSKAVEVTLLPPHQQRGASTLKGWFTTTAPATFDKVAAVSAGLGVLIGIGLCLSILNPSAGMYMVATGIFHLLEFLITARFNPAKIGMASFLLTNGVEYVLAQLLAAAEFAVRQHYGRSPLRLTFGTGLLMVVCGQMIRSGAMVQAAASFSHFLQNQRKEDHVLVRHGFYGVVRHPSYSGFYLWAVGTQIMLGNIVSTIAFATVLLHFFKLRIREEEPSLVRFFGKDYIDYRAAVWSGIPFIK